MSDEGRKYFIDEMSGKVWPDFVEGKTLHEARVFTLPELAAMKAEIRREALEEVRQWIKDAEGDIDFVTWSMNHALAEKG